ncbi:MAG: phospholipid carrier-dependent glycosyltransferase [Patescibacteria group bacterium]
MRLKILLILYLLITTISLTALPVFSDEAIYIHWAQVATNEPSKYAFLPMLDGKPPLHVWTLIPMLKLTQDPLLAGRLVSVFVGLVNIILIGMFVRELGGETRDERLAQLVATILPFWFFHNRMALAEVMLVMWLLLGLVAGIRAYANNKKSFFWTIVFSLAVGGSLWTKVSGLFFVPVFLMIPLLIISAKTKKLSVIGAIREGYLHTGVIRLFIGGVIGGLIFLTLRLSPLFPYLFARSADYAFTLRDLLGGEWRFVVFAATPRLMYWLVWYLSPFIFILALRSGRRGLVLFLMSLAYALPLLVGGRVVYSRYFLPMAVPLTIMAVFGFRELYNQGNRNKTLALICLGGAVLWSSMFILPSYIRPGLTPFALQDQVQYLTEWSSGYGIPQVRDYLRQQIAQRTNGQQIEVGTEGYFGTLPDGLSIYFNDPIYADKIKIDGVGQPIHAIPDRLLQSAKTQDTYLVVNSHRFFLENTSNYEVVGVYDRPYGGPKLLLLRILPQKQ